MCLQHPSTAVRHMASRCVGVMSKIATMETMNIFLEKVLPWLGAIDDNTKQEGAIEALACILACVFKSAETSLLLSHLGEQKQLPEEMGGGMK